MSDLKDKHRELKTQLKKLPALPYTPEVAKERAEISERLRKCESDLFVRKANRWGVEIPYEPEWYAVEVEDEGRTVGIMLPYLNETGRAVFTYRIRKAKAAFWSAALAPVIAILSLIVAIIALLR